MDDLVTERLVLHPLSVMEAERVASGEPDDGDRWAPGYPADGDMVGARRFLTTCAITGDPAPFGAYEIRIREDGRAIGGLGFHGAPDENLVVTIGYGLIPSARGRGYASEALRRLLRFARESGIVRVGGDADLDNIASQRVMTAAGMRLVGEDEQLRYYDIAWDDDRTTVSGP
ncbi:GNAT family N-acetyltransferase [Streptomyces sp. AK02-01A]|uniref:GNAT family N-acetyltransferase n=1 Tax=Streptomyces sp. AK02-01A TaxID=3028648 RepID=UPI0029BB76C9|nr:GNAT family N-acetyltransferase [Streptomyces sp. AK02-01A]MDX3854525.1 GNAT family N-acetyltransferase [Streptomyces sp. AK02-01A]